MNKFFWLLLLAGLWVPRAAAQRYLSERSEVSFFSETPLENIAATTAQATSLYDATTAQVAFSIPVRTFVFPKALMQEHFNESYLETDKYPKATFQGKVSGFVPARAGRQSVMATGQLTLHGVTRPVTVPGKMEAKDGKITLLATFPVKLADYRVDVPKVVFYNIAESIDVKLNFVYQPHEK